MKELILRFLIGGTLVSAFALIGDLLRPKSFAGLFGAAPFSCAGESCIDDCNGRQGLCCGGGSLHDRGGGRVLPLCIDRKRSSKVMMLYKAALAATLGLMPVWLGASYGLWLAWAR
jgi:hypothetical protein